MLHFIDYGMSCTPRSDQQRVYPAGSERRMADCFHRVFAAMLNSLYSFYWDIARDWDLTLFSQKRNDPSHPYGLRRMRVFDAPSLYYAVIVVDLALRCSWSMKLSVHLEHFNDIEGGIFMLELLEIFRRWMWVFFRVEAEWLRARASGDVLLDDLGPKLDPD